MKNITNYSLLSNLFWIFKIYLNHSKVLTFFRVLGTILNSLQDIIFIFFIGKIIDELIKISTNQTNASLNNLIPYIALLLFINILSIISYNIWGFTANMLNAAMTDLVPKNLLYQKINNVDVLALENPKFLNKLTRFKDNGVYVSRFFDTAMNLIGLLSQTVIICLSILTLNILLIPLIIITALPNVFVNKKFLKDIWKLDRNFTSERRKAIGVMDKLLDSSSFKEIKIIGAHKYLHLFFYKYFRKYNSLQIGIRKRWLISATLTRILGYVGVGVSYLIVFSKLLNDEITVGQVTFFIGILSNFSANITSVINNFTNLVEGNDRVQELRFVLSFTSKHTDGKLHLDSTNSVPEINIKDLDFKYPRSESFIFQDFNLNIKPGEKIAIVGENGAGKTTLVKLLARLYKPQNGEIFINNLNLNEIVLDDWYEKLGILFQDYNTYPDLTANENIVLGKIDSKDKVNEVVEAAKKADAFEFIQKYPEKFEQILSEKYEGGTRPSTGQWQKIAIARFFFRNAPILILDEPTASIDAVAEANIFDRVYEFIKDKTVIIISHRFSTVRNADRIIVLDKGKIVEEGNHNALMKLDGKYAKAFKLQAKGYEGEVV